MPSIKFSNMTIDFSKVNERLETLVSEALRPELPSGGFVSMAEKAQVLAAYATYRMQDMSVIKLQEGNTINANAQAASIKELNEQVKQTKNLFIATTILAIGTLVLAATTVVASVFHL